MWKTSDNKISALMGRERGGNMGCELMLRQQSLWEVVCGANFELDRNDCAVQVTDLFCGAGGFSCGAIMAGCKVVFACDSDKMALETHSLNHPDTRHCCGNLPDVDIPLPMRNARTHLHGSPPCQMFSTMHTRGEKSNRAHPARKVAESLVEWYLQFAISSNFDTWTMEQVPAPDVIQIVELFKRKHPSQIAFAVIDMAQLGVPQHRKRLIAGSPAIVAWLLRTQSLSKVCSVAVAIQKPRGTHIRNGKCWSGTKDKKASVYENMRSISKPTYTVTTGGDLRWVTPGSKTNKWLRLTVREKATLQTFPDHYRLPIARQVSCLQIGNAVPPLVAKLLMRFVSSGRTPAPPSSTPLSPSLRLFPAPLSRGYDRAVNSSMPRALPNRSW